MVPLRKLDCTTAHRSPDLAAPTPCMRVRNDITHSHNPHQPRLLRAPPCTPAPIACGCETEHQAGTSRQKARNPAATCPELGHPLQRATHASIPPSSTDAHRKATTCDNLSSARGHQIPARTLDARPPPATRRTAAGTPGTNSGSQTKHAAADPQRRGDSAIRAPRRRHADKPSRDATEGTRGAGTTARTCQGNTRQISAGRRPKVAAAGNGHPTAPATRVLEPPKHRCRGADPCSGSASHSPMATCCRRPAFHREAARFPILGSRRHGSRCIACGCVNTCLIFLSQIDFCFAGRGSPGHNTRCTMVQFEYLRFGNPAVKMQVSIQRSDAAAPRLDSMKIYSVLLCTSQTRYT